MKHPIRSLVSTAIVAVIASQAQAGSFSLYTESSGAMVGNYAAGAAAEARDASTGWYNPAGLALLDKKQVVFSGVGVMPRSDITGTSTYTTFIAPNTPVNYRQTIQNLQGADSGFVPAFHAAYPFNDKTTFGLSVVAPFGLATDWGTSSPVRYEATFTDLMTVDIAPEIGYKLTDDFLIGAGLDIEYAKVKFNRVLGAPALLSVIGPAFGPFYYDSVSYNKGDSWGVGFHAGIMKLFNDNHTRIGLNYQSQVRQKFSGWSELRGPLASQGSNIFGFNANQNAVFRSDNLSSEPVNLPDVATLSIYQDINDKFAILGSVVYTGWSSLSTLQLNNVAVAAISAPPLFPGVISNATTNSVSELHYRDAWRAALGVNYMVNDKLMLRVGGGYDQTPTVDGYRDIRVPDADRWALSVGAHYQMRPDIGIDVGYTHLFAADDIVINKTEAIGATSSYNVNATGSGYANLVGAQLVWTIDNPMPMPTK